MRLREVTIYVLSMIFTACSQSKKVDNDPLHYFTDMEQYDGFTENIAILEMKNAYSGKFALKINAASQYSVTFKKKNGRYII